MKKREPVYAKSKARGNATLATSNGPIQDAVTVADITGHLQDWLMDGQFRQHSPRTRECRENLQQKLLWFLQRENADTCGISQLRGFLAHVASGHEEPSGRWGNPRMNKPVRPATVHSYYRELRVFFNWLVEEGVLAVSPVDRLAAPQLRTEQVQPFTPEQTQSILHAAQQSVHPRRNEAIVLFLLDTGIRASELCSLKMSDLDIKGQRCTVVGKGNKRRTIHFGRTVTKALWRYLQEQAHQESDPIFISDRGTSAGEHLTRSGLLQLVEKLGKKAKLQAVRCSPHTFRHTFAVDFLRNGGNVFSLKEMLGHTGLHMTNKYVALAQADIANQHRQFSPADRLKASRT